MRSTFRTAGAVFFAAGLTAGIVAASDARAAGGTPINGTYVATSVGEWAKTNQAFHERQTVHSTWTITSTCDNPQECSGQVTSDEGWSAPLKMHDGLMWYVTRDLPNWERCEDGTSFPGHQTYKFYYAGLDGGYIEGSSTLAGKDKTVGTSGACGVNKWFVVEMPFRLDKLT